MLVPNKMKHVLCTGNMVNKQQMENLMAYPMGKLMELSRVF